MEMLVAIVTAIVIIVVIINAVIIIIIHRIGTQDNWHLDIDAKL